MNQSQMAFFAWEEMKKIRKRSFDTNWIAPLGANVNGLESDLESYLAEDCSVGALSSGTAARHFELILLGVEAGDTVICQSMTFQHLQIQYCILEPALFY
jgi:dTDP-4-amino-4,6-dideoxygalactose transaminase